MADESSTMDSTSEMLDMDSSEMVDMLSGEALMDVESGITDGSENRKLTMSLDEIIMASKKKKSSPQQQQQQHRRRPFFNNKYYRNNKGDTDSNMFKATETEAEPEIQSLDDLILANKIAGRGRSRRGRGGHNNGGGRSQSFAPYEASFSRQSFNPPPRFARGALHHVHSRPRGGGVGPIRKKPNAHAPARFHPHSQAGPRASVFSRLGGRRLNEKTQGTKIFISNLNPTKVSARDVHELFSNSNAIPLLSCRLHFDNNNNFLGTAEVKFSRMEDAIEAVRNYHDVPLDGMPMKIDFME